MKNQFQFFGCVAHETGGKSLRNESPRSISECISEERRARSVVRNVLAYGCREIRIGLKWGCGTCTDLKING